MKLRNAADAAGWVDYRDVATELGVDPTTVNRYFNGRREPGAIVVCQMMILFKIGPADLLGQTASQRQGTRPAGPQANDPAVKDLQGQVAYLEGVLADLRADIDHRVSAVEWEQAQTSRAVES